MLKRVGILAFVLTAGAFVQPAVASAQDRFDRGNNRTVQGNREQPRDQPRFRQEYREPEERENWNRDRFVREDRDRSFRRDDDRAASRRDSDDYGYRDNRR